jgi:hypothetical protein
MFILKRRFIALNVLSYVVGDFQFPHLVCNIFQVWWECIIYLTLRPKYDGFGAFKYLGK